MRNDIWKKYGIWLNVAIFLVVILSLVCFVALPMKQNIADSVDGFKKKKIDNELDAERIAKIPDMEKTHVVISEKRNELDVVLDKNNELNLIEQLESLASETGNGISLQIEYVSPNDKNVKAVAAVVDSKSDGVEKIETLNVDRLVVHIALTGNYSQLFNFLNKLENMQYSANVIALDLEKKSIDNGNSSVSSYGNNLFATNKIPSENNVEVKNSLQSKIDAIVYLKN